ncbi:19022_t:CDS:1, partial [Racocetra persica]
CSLQQIEKSVNPNCSKEQRSKKRKLSVTQEYPDELSDDSKILKQ